LAKQEQRLEMHVQLTERGKRIVELLLKRLENNIKKKTRKRTDNKRPLKLSGIKVQEGVGCDGFS